MAKRRRLTPATSPAEATGQLGTKSRFPFGVAPSPSRPPVAQVAGDAAEWAAAHELSRSLVTAREEGRLAIPLPLSSIIEDHLVRDRLVADDEELAVLEASLRARGQQTPVDVVEVGQGRYGLISGWRRLEALRRIGADTVLAMVRRPEGASQAYLAMVEENEVRVGLSFYERGRVAAEAVRLGLYPDPTAAVTHLFASAPAPRRSKILSFVAVHDSLGSVLCFPAAIPEKLGLALAATVSDRDRAARLRDALRKAAPESAEAERAILERAVRKPPSTPRPAGDEVAPGIRLQTGRGRVVLSGPGVDAALAKALAAWFADR